MALAALQARLPFDARFSMDAMKAGDRIVFCEARKEGVPAYRVVVERDTKTRALTLTVTKHWWLGTVIKAVAVGILAVTAGVAYFYAGEAFASIVLLILTSGIGLVPAEFLTDKFEKPERIVLEEE